jgi:hypothetical protein
VEHRIDQYVSCVFCAVKLGVGMVLGEVEGKKNMVLVTPPPHSFRRSPSGNLFV